LFAGCSSTTKIAFSGVDTSNIDKADTKLSPAERVVNLTPTWKRKERDEKASEKNAPSVLDGPRKKKRAGIPKRPLSAYNYFLQAERARLIEQGHKMDERSTSPRYVSYWSYTDLDCYALDVLLTCGVSSNIMKWTVGR